MVNGQDYEQASAAFVAGLGTCVIHLDVDEVFEVCRKGGEAELNDLLRHATNRIVRAEGLIVEREYSDPTGPMKRIDIAMFEQETGSPRAWVEAKMRFATDAVRSKAYVIEGVKGKQGIASDARKLLAGGAAGPGGLFLLTWAPHFGHIRRPLRYMAGHEKCDDGSWRANEGLEDCRNTFRSLLSDFGQTQMVEVMTDEGRDGQITLDAWWTWLQPVGSSGSKE